MSTITTVQLPASGTYQIDTSHADVGFQVRHLMISKVRGRFADVTGTITIAEDPLASSVAVSIAAASVDTRDEQRDAHLRSPDFLDVERFPTLEYRSTGITPIGEGRWRVDGELTAHGVTRPVALDLRLEGIAADPWGNERVGFSARAELEREAFGLTWNQALETGGVLVGKTVTIEIEAEVVRDQS